MIDLSKTSEFLKNLTGSNKIDELTLKRVNRIVSENLFSDCRISDNDTVEELSKIRFVKVVIDKSNDDNYRFNTLEVWYGKDENDNEYIFKTSDISGLFFDEYINSKIDLFSFNIDLEAEYSGIKTTFIETKSTAKVFVKNDKVYVKIGYNKTFISLSKIEDGIWNDPFWIFSDEKLRKVVELVEAYYPTK